MNVASTLSRELHSWIDEILVPIGRPLLEWIEQKPEQAQTALLSLWVVGVVVMLGLRRHPHPSALLLETGFVAATWAQLQAYRWNPEPKALWLTSSTIVLLLGLSAWAAARLRRAVLAGEPASPSRRAFVGLEPEPLASEQRPALERFGRLVFAAGLLALATLPMRFWRLGEFPRPFEAEFLEPARAALQVLETGRPFLIETLRPHSGQFVVYVGRPHMLVTDAYAVIFWIYGASIEVMKLLPTTLGILAVVGAWVVGRRWIGPGAGWAAALLMAVSPYMLSLSRNLWAGIILCVPYAYLAVHCVARAVEEPRFRTLLPATAVVMTALYLYRPTYVVIPLFVASCLGKLLFDREWRRRAWAPLLCSAILAAALVVPFGYFSYKQRYLHRLKAISGIGVNPTPASTLFQRNLYGSLDKTLYLQGDRILASIGANWGFGGFGHLPLISTFFVIGLGATLAGAWHRTVDRALLLLLLLAFLPGVLSKQLFFRRLIMVSPVFFLLAGRGCLGVLAFVWDGLPRAARLIAAVGLIGSAFALTAVSHALYVRHLYQFEPDSIRPRALHIARAIETDFVVAPFDYGLENAAYVEAWNRVKCADVQRRLFIAGDAQNAPAIPEDPARPAWVQFVIKPSRRLLDEPGLLRQKLAGQTERHPEWTFAIEGAGGWRFVWLRVPQRDLIAARDFLWPEIVQRPLVQPRR